MNKTIEEIRNETDANIYIDRAIAMLKEKCEGEYLVAGYNGIVSLLQYAKESHQFQQEQKQDAGVTIMNKEQPTQSKEEILQKYETYVSYNTEPIFLKKNVLLAMGEYASQLTASKEQDVNFTIFHVQAALKAAAANVKTKTEKHEGVGWDFDDELTVVDKESILNAYPLTNIKSEINNLTASGAVWVRASERLSQVDVKKNLRINEAIPATGKLISKETKDYIIQYFGENVTAILPAEYVVWLDETHIPEKGSEEVNKEIERAAKLEIADDMYIKELEKENKDLKQQLEEASRQYGYPVPIAHGYTIEEWNKKQEKRRKAHTEEIIKPQEQSKPVMEWLDKQILFLEGEKELYGKTERIRTRLSAFNEVKDFIENKSSQETNPVSELSDEEIKDMAKKAFAESKRLGAESPFIDGYTAGYKAALQTSAAGWSDKDMENSFESGQSVGNTYQPHSYNEKFKEWLDQYKQSQNKS